MSRPSEDVSRLSREGVRSILEKEPRFDVVVIGGGIHGTAVARLAAANRYRTLLLERDDYASATSSRSSKMAHGGLRYLELFDFLQVFEGIRARENLFTMAPHLVKPREFLIPVPKGQTLFRWKLSLGLTLYDLFVRKQERRHRWIPAMKERIPVFEDRPLQGAFIYCDGLMNDTRLVLENILSARRQGALCLNYGRVDGVKKGQNGKVRVQWTDRIGGDGCEVEARIVINCAGPWVAEAGGAAAAPLSEKIRYSQGTHLLFRRPWDGPALFLPMKAKTRYYFVWPHFAGTLVGTTEREIQAPVSQDPFPGKDEVDEILHRLERDLPGSGLNRENLHYAFAGVRTLPLRGTKKGTERLSRRHVWTDAEGVVSLIGGKLTTAAWTAGEGLKRAAALADLPAPCAAEAERLPGAVGFQEAVEAFLRKGERRGIPGSLLSRTVARLGSRVRSLLDRPEAMEVIGDRILRGEVETAIREDQAERLEDLMRRRMDLEYTDGCGLDLLPAIAKILGRAKPNLDLAEEVRKYRDRIHSLWKLIGDRT